MHDTANKKVSGALPITFPVALTCLAYLDAMLLRLFSPLDFPAYDSESFYASKALRRTRGMADHHR